MQQTCLAKEKEKIKLQVTVIFPFSNFLIQVTNLAVFEEVTDFLTIAAHMLFKSFQYKFTCKIIKIIIHIKVLSTGKTQCK